MDVLDDIESRGLACDRSVKIGRWTFDGRIIGTRILIEADGDYWHSSPTVQERDARKDRWCDAHGWILLRVAESAYRDDPSHEIDVIVQRWQNHTGQLATRVDASGVVEPNPIPVPDDATPEIAAEAEVDSEAEVVSVDGVEAEA